MLHIIWRFRAKPDRLEQFLDRYNPEGVWAEFFRKSHDYKGTELWKDGSDRYRFLTIDHWSSEEAYARFCAESREEYAALDRDCEHLTEEEVRVGMFTDEESH